MRQRRTRSVVAVSCVCATLAGALLAEAQSSRSGMGSTIYAGVGGTGVTFRVWAPFASSVGVKGQFNGWATTPLVSEGASGLWSRDIPGARAGQEYKYVVNGTLDRRDPRNRRVTHSAGNSVIYDPQAFNWEGQTFTQPWRNDLVLYEMHVGTFNAEQWVPSSFDKALEKLDHIQALGINAIQLMPVNEFASDKSWGYNPADPFAIESALGGPDAFKRFVKACHARGIAVLLDIVHNHYGPSDLSMWQFDGWNQNGFGGIYFYNDKDRASTWWGDTRPDFGRSEVRAFIKDCVQMCLEEYHVDGLRWDSVFNILYYKDGANQNGDGRSLLNEINETMRTTYPDRYRIAEDNAFDFSVQFESQWDTDFQNHLRWQVTQSSDADRNMGWLGDRLVNGAGLHRVIFSECHDSVGDLNKKHRLPRDIDPGNPWSVWARKRELLAASMVMTAPGIPMVFQGQEMNEDWTFSAETSLRWSLTNTFSGIVRAYGDLIHLRRNLRGGTQGLKGTGITAYHRDDLNKVIAFVRWDAGGGADDVVVVANFAVKTWTNDNYMIEFPLAGDWYCWFNSDSKDYSGDFGGLGPMPGGKVTASGSPARAAVNMGMYSTLIFSRTAPPSAGHVTFDPPHPSGCVDISLTYSPSNGPLASATQVVAFVGRNDWQDSRNISMSRQGSQWTCIVTSAPGTASLEAAFHNGDGTSPVWDNHLGLNWKIAITNCAELPAYVSVSPYHPQGCVPVRISYQPNGGPLKSPDQVYLYLGRNGWKESRSLAMTNISVNEWEYTMPIPDETWELNFVFHDNSTTQRWDNNNGANWLTEVSECVSPIQPYVSITNPPSDLGVSNQVTGISLKGKMSDQLSGQLVWTNVDAQTHGVLPAGVQWSISSLPLIEGINRIWVSGTNGSVNPNHGVMDDATLPTYTDSMSWTNGQQGGNGWQGGWSLAAIGSAGHFLASSSSLHNLKISSHAWGLWANNDGYAEARRRFVAPLHTGDVFTCKINNNWIESGKSVGIAFQNRYGDNLFEFYFEGGSTNYVLNDDDGLRPTGIPWTDQGLSLAFELTAPTAYRLTAGEASFTGNLKSESEQSLLYFRTWNYSAGSGSNYNFYVNSLAIQGDPLDMVTYRDDVTITRAYGPRSDPDGDGYITSDEELAGTNPYSAQSHPPLARGAMSASGSSLTFQLSDTVLSRWYTLAVATNLLNPQWTNITPPLAGSGSSASLTVTGRTAESFYRISITQTP
jgi:1,4-alpha-glucan branching enzyme